MTDAELDRMERLWAEGVPVAEIARELCYSPSAVYATAGRLRERFPARNSWTALRAREPELVNAAIGMFADGMTGRQVADELGISLAMAYRIHRGFV